MSSPAMAPRSSIGKLGRRLLGAALALGRGRQCPICGWAGYAFLPFGIPAKRRFDARCPRCGSLERHRLAFLVARELVEREAADTLHVAPEESIGPWLRARSKTYVSIDLHGAAMRTMDLRALEFADASFSLVWCSHVLEHIVEDRVAIAELSRVCRPGGRAVVQVPIWRQSTFEDSRVTSEAERLASFFQKDHVRLYGPDIVERFEEAGFSHRVARAADLGPALVVRHGLSFVSTNEVFLLRRE